MPAVTLPVLLVIAKSPKFDGADDASKALSVPRMLVTVVTVATVSLAGSKLFSPSRSLIVPWIPAIRFDASTVPSPPLVPASCGGTAPSVVNTINGLTTTLAVALVALTPTNAAPVSAAVNSREYSPLPTAAAVFVALAFDAPSLLTLHTRSVRPVLPSPEELSIA